MLDILLERIPLLRKGRNPIEPLDFTAVCYRGSLPEMEAFRSVKFAMSDANQLRMDSSKTEGERSPVPLRWQSTGQLPT